MRTFEKVFPWLMVSLAALYLANSAWSRGNGGDTFNFQGFGELPVQEGGRLQPMDTFARIRLMQVRNTQSFIDVDDKKKPAVKWLLDVMTLELIPKDGQSPMHQQAVFRIDNDQVLNFFRLPPRSGFRYSLLELSPRMKDFSILVQHLENKNSSDYTDQKFLELSRRLNVVRAIASGLEPHVIPAEEASEEAWSSLFAATESRPNDAALVAFNDMLKAYANKNPERFNAALTKYRERLEQTNPGVTKKTGLEAFFNRFAPFERCTELFVLIFILTCFSWIGWATPLSRAAIFLTILALAVHTWAILARMMIMGRPPVTNLYASAIFIGWGCVGLCLALTWMFRNTIPLAVGAISGIFTLIIAHNLVSGDTMDVLLPVLDTNLWLATHVVIITIGYTATFVAGLIGAAYILIGVMTPFLIADVRGPLSKMIYGVICFATLLSFTGTVLGGIWADQSWGRFWGWDPKENGALLIVIWNAIVLHARWGGMVKQRGIAVLAVGGNIVTAWSWFGTNMLPVGLHSYGRMEGAMAWLIFFVAVQLLIIGAGLIPLKYWYSYAPKAPPPSGVGGGGHRGISGNLRTGIKTGSPPSGAGPSTGIRAGVAGA